MEIIRQGEINSIDISKGKARVIFLDCDNKVSDWLNILVPFSDSHFDNYNLSVGQSVLVLSIPEMPEIGYILGCPMRESDIVENEVKRTFSDGGFYTYKNGNLILNPIEKVIINANTEINGNLEINGNTTVNGNTMITGTTITGRSINLNTHTHKGIMPGDGKTKGPE